MTSADIRLMTQRPLDSFALRGAPCRDGQAAPLATRRGVAVQRSPYRLGSPLLYRAHISMRGPADTNTARPSARIASSASVRGDRPPSIVAMITGHAARVDSKRASTLFDGISRNWYPTAPSRKNSLFSPGCRGCGPTTALLQSRWLVSGRSSSGSGLAFSSSTFVFTAFALRGAPCGDDARLWAAFRRYHEQQPAKRRGSDDPGALLVLGVRLIRKPSREVPVQDRLGLLERHSVPDPIFTRLLRIPGVPRHRGTVVTAPYPRLIR